MNRTAPPLLRAGVIGTLLAALAVPAGSAAASAAEAATPSVVRPGQSIQQALDAAPDGATVVVSPGVYAENLLIDRPVTLVARGQVTLTPPASLVPNPCTEDPDAVASGTNATGICIIGSLDTSQDPPVVTGLLAGVTVRGLAVRGFAGIGVEAYATQGLHLERVTATGNQAGGFFVAQSLGTELAGVLARANGSRGISLQWGDDGATISGATVTANHGEGVFVGDSHGVGVTASRIADNCAGIVAVDMAITGSGLSDLALTGNEVIANNRLCPGDGEGSPSESGTGIALVGAVDSTATGNRVLDNVGSPSAVIAFGGIALLDARDITGGASASGDTVVGNVAQANSPFDLFIASTGDNTVDGNRCLTRFDNGQVRTCR